MKKYNHLINEKSPYLLQHAENPVDWYPWCDEAFERAKNENKPIFLSIGYSTCHWCHVMEKESFQDEEVAKILNENFISIKVDREERPDIDSVYMNICQAMTGHGGWPLTIIMTPDKKPFFAGTYIPKYSKYNRLGLIDLLQRIAQLWNENREKLLLLADQITDEIKQALTHICGNRNLYDHIFHQATLSLMFFQPLLRLLYFQLFSNISAKTSSYVGLEISVQSQIRHIRGQIEIQVDRKPV